MHYSIAPREKKAYMLLEARAIACATPAVKVMPLNDGNCRLTVSSDKGQCFHIYFRRV